MKKLLVFLVIVAAIIGIAWAGLRFMVPWQHYVDQAAQQIEQDGHYQLRGGMQLKAVSLLPQPIITLESLNLSPASDQHAVELSSNHAQIVLDIQAWLEGASLPIDRVILHEPNIRQRQAQVTDLLPTLSHLPIAVEFVNGRWSSESHDLTISNINGTLRPVGDNGGAYVQGSANLQGKMVELEWFMNTNPATAPADVAGKIADDHSSLAVKGSFAQKGTQWQYHGHTILKSTQTANALTWWDQAEDLIGNSTELNAMGDMTLAGQLTLRPDGFALKETTLSFSNMGSINVAYVHRKKDQQHQFKLTADTLHITKEAEAFALFLHRQWRDKRLAKFQEEEAKVARIRTKLVDSTKFSTLFPPEWKVVIELDAAEIAWREQQIKNFSTLSELHFSNWTIQHVKAILPGETVARSLGGVLKQTDKGWEYDGSLEWSSKQLRDALRLIGLPEHLIRQPALGPSTGRGRFSFGPTLLRIAENSFTLDKQQGKFSLLYYYPSKKHPKGLVDAAVSVKRTNLDAYLPNTPWFTWFKERDFDKSVDLTAPFPDWLATIPVDAKIRLVANAAKLRGLPWQQLRASCYITGEALGCKNFKASLRKQPTEMSFHLEREGPRPKLKLNLKTPGLTSADIMTAVDYNKQPMATYTPQAQWSDVPYTPEFWNMADMDIKASIGKLFFTRELHLEDFRLDAASSRMLWDIRIVEAKMIGGHAAFNGKIGTGKLPSINGNFSLKGVDINQLANLKIPMPALKGNISVAGALNGEGYSPLRMVQNLNANIDFASKNLVAAPLDINGMARKVSYVRSMDDVVNLSRIAVSEGTTRFSEFSGKANLKNGILSITEARHSTTAAAGFLRGVIDIRDMQMNTALSFQLKTQIGGDAPPVQLMLQGDITDPVRELNVRELENYIAKKQVR